MPITYDPDTNTITIVGTKDGQPYCFEDIYQADVNNGWNKFTKLSEGVYKTTAKLQFGDGSTETLFKEKGTTLIIENTASKDWDTIITFKANCNATFGEYEKVDTAKLTKNGVEFQLRETNYSASTIMHEINSCVCYYGCKFKWLKSSNWLRIVGSVHEIIGSLSEIIFVAFNNTKIIKTILIGEGGKFSGGVNLQVEDVLINTTQDSAFYISNSSYTFKKLAINAKDHLADVYKLQSPNVVKFVNCKAMNWVIRWILDSGQVSGELQRVYAVVFKVTDVNGNPLMSRIVKVYNRNGDLVAELQTDSNGLTDEVEILYAKLTNPYADNTWHTFTDEDWEYFNPFTIEVYYGNELEYRGVITDLDVESTFIQITVKPSSLTINDLANKIEYIRKLFGNRWKIENNELKIYDDDNQTVIRRFKLYDKEGKPTETNIYDRVPI